MVDAALFSTQGLQLAAAVVDDADGRAETEFDGALADGEGILRIRDAAPYYRVDVHVKLGMFGEQLQLLVENLQAFFRNFVGIYVVDGDLQPFESGAVEALNALGDQQIAVGDECGDHAIAPDAADSVGELGLHQRPAPGNSRDRGAERAQLIDP